VEFATAGDEIERFLEKIPGLLENRCISRTNPENILIVKKNDLISYLKSKLTKVLL